MNKGVVGECGGPDFNSRLIDAVLSKERPNKDTELEKQLAHIQEVSSRIQAHRAVETHARLSIQANEAIKEWLE